MHCDGELFGCRATGDLVTQGPKFQEVRSFHYLGRISCKAVTQDGNVEVLARSGPLHAIFLSFEASLGQSTTFAMRWKSQWLLRRATKMMASQASGR
jgi:hypothetical protein